MDGWMFRYADDEAISLHVLPSTGDLPIREFLLGVITFLACHMDLYPVPAKCSFSFGIKSDGARSAAVGKGLIV